MKAAESHRKKTESTAPKCAQFYCNRMVPLSALVASSGSIAMPHTAARIDVHPRAVILMMGHKQKPRRYAEPAPPPLRLPSASHTKTRNNWRSNDGSSENDVPTLATGQLPKPRHGERIPVGRYPALVLNADYQPLSFVPLSLWSWHDSVRAVFRGAVTVISSYNVSIRSPSVEMELPSVIVLNKYVGREGPSRGPPCFTRRNLFLRDEFQCQYCRETLTIATLTYDHVVPRSRGGPTNWENIVTCCNKCNRKKGQRRLESISDMSLRQAPRCPTWPELHNKARSFPPKDMHEHWAVYVAPYPPRRGVVAPTEGSSSEYGEEFGI